jgi:hypothetical protein
MSYEIKPIVQRDAGKIAYMILKWDAELPDHLRMLNGDAVYAEQAANFIIASPLIYGYKLEIDKELAGGYALQSAQGIFSPRRYGQLLTWYVDPKHRAGLNGFRLLKHAIKTATDNKLAWLEVNPWADAHGAQYVLAKLGFIESVHSFMLRTS